MLLDKNECLIIQTKIQGIFTAFEGMKWQWKIKGNDPLFATESYSQKHASRELIKKGMAAIISGALEMLDAVFNDFSS